MSSVAIVHTLLETHAPLTALVSNRIYSGTIPQGTALPCLGVTEVVTTEMPHIDASSPTQLVDGRVQVTVIAGNYPAMKGILELVRKACNYKRGMLAGYEVASVHRLSNGPDFETDDNQLHIQSIDFSVIYYEATT